MPPKKYTAELPKEYRDYSSDDCAGVIRNGFFEGIEGNPFHLAWLFVEAKENERILQEIKRGILDTFLIDDLELQEHSAGQTADRLILYFKKCHEPRRLAWVKELVEICTEIDNGELRDFLVSDVTKHIKSKHEETLEGFLKLRVQEQERKAQLYEAAARNSLADSAKAEESEEKDAFADPGRQDPQREKAAVKKPSVNRLGTPAPVQRK